MDSTTSTDRAAYTWNSALTLHERTRPLPDGASPRDAHLTTDRERGERRLERWRSQTAFEHESRFEQRLRADNVSRDQLVALLGESTDSLDARHRGPPEWSQTFLRALNGQVSDDLLSSVLEAQPERPQYRFLLAVEPLIDDACRRLRGATCALRDEFPCAPFDSETVERLVLPGWCDAIVQLLDQTFVLELNVARLEERLDGNTPHERFESFVTGLRGRRGVEELFREYPVLARQIVTKLEHLLDATTEFLRRLAADRRDLETLVGRDAGKLSTLDTGAGDSHCKGRSVAIVGFESGRKVVYKPRSLSIDVHFQRLLGWLNDHGDHPAFRTHGIVERGSYGWAEFVEREDCATVAEIQRFYRRQGAFLALLYALRATDFHFENVMASGEHPMLLDLESLFHPHKEIEVQQTSEMLANDAILGSVLGVGLLPHRLFLGGDEKGIDISGMGAVEPQLSPDSLPYWEAVGSDEMHMKRRRMMLEAGAHLPTLRGERAKPVDHVDDVVEGFGAMYRLLLARSDELLSDSGPLAAFRGDRVRVILRHTRSYGLLLQESSHPDVLRDALDTERLLDHLWKDVESEPRLARIIGAEKQDLRNGDIPLFTTRLGSRDVWTSEGERVEEFLDSEATVSIGGRIRELNADDLARQEWFIHASFASTVSFRVTRSRVHEVRVPEIAREGDEYIEAAAAVGSRLGSLALRNETEAVWLGLTLLDESTWSLVSSGLDLYSGLPGIGLFLGYLGEATGREEFTDLAIAATRTMRGQVERNRQHAAAVGAFTGWGGVIYALAQLGDLWNDREIAEEAVDLALDAGALIERDDRFDIIDGASGFLGCLLSVYERERTEAILDIAVRCGDWLVEHAQPMSRGVAWPQSAMGQHPLAGFAHGAAGISWSLLKLSAATGEERFRETALRAIEFERDLFSSEHANWPDRRIDPGDPDTMTDEPRFMTAWCNGAPGIGLARLDTLAHLDDEPVREEIAAAVRTTQAAGFGDNHSLCHGDLGNVELLLRAGELEAHAADRERAYRLAAGILEHGRAHGWQCGVPMHTETPGLMTGLAGIGYGLLRIALPDRVPSVLTLDGRASRGPRL